MGISALRRRRELADLRRAERDERRNADRLYLSLLMAVSVDELRARLTDTHRQRRLLRQALRAKRRQGGQAS